ncbi:hypothetical protein AAZV13_09G066900 [Glycine max]
MQSRILCFSTRRLPLHQRRFLSHFIPDHQYDPPFSPSPKPYYKSKKNHAEKKKKNNSENGDPNKNGAPKLPFKSNLPFDFRYSYSESDPSVGPISFRESPKFSPFGPGRIDRKWTGVSAPVQGEPDRERVEEERNRILGEPLSEVEVAELIERYRHSDCARQINLGKGGVTHNMLGDIHNHWKKAEVVRIKCLGVPTLDMDNVCFHLEVVKLDCIHVGTSDCKKIGVKLRDLVPCVPILFKDEQIILWRGNFKEEQPSDSQC